MELPGAPGGGACLAAGAWRPQTSLGVLCWPLPLARLVPRSAARSACGPISGGDIFPRLRILSSFPQRLPAVNHITSQNTAHYRISPPSPSHRAGGIPSRP